VLLWFWQDKAHCPFHLKTAACRFGDRCSRVHFYPDKSCTILIKNMYNGPGLAWEQDEGLEVCSSASVSYFYSGDGIYSICSYFFCSFHSIIIRDIHFRGGSPFWLSLLQRKHITCCILLDMTTLGLTCQITSFIHFPLPSYISNITLYALFSCECQHNILK